MVAERAPAYARSFESGKPQPSESADTFADGVAVLIDSDGQLGTISSSRRYKQDIEDMADASAALNDLRAVTFRYKQAFDDGSKPIQFGLIAEEVAEVFPELVVFGEDGQPETVKYHLLSSLLLNEFQKLALRNQSVEASYEKLRAEKDREIAALRAEKGSEIESAHMALLSDCFSKATASTRS